MKLLIAALALALLGGLACQTTSEQEDPRDKWGENPMENPEFMEAWMASAAPGEAHQEIAKGAGTWDVVTKMYMEPGAEAQVSAAVAESRLILGGRYLVEEFRGEFEGMPFEGQLLLGYDNVGQEYFSVWCDNMSTAAMVARGVKGEDGKVVQIGTIKDVLTPEGRPYKHVSWSDSDDLQHAAMYDTMPDGTEWLVMEMTYRRRR